MFFFAKSSKPFQNSNQNFCSLHATMKCNLFVFLLCSFQKGITRRAVGSSNIHDESSRSHAFLEIEIVNQELIDAREAVLEAESIRNLHKFTTTPY